MARVGEGGNYANSWSGYTTTVDLFSVVPHDVTDALARNHNITSVNRHGHGLTVDVTIANSIGDDDARQALSPYMNLPWKSYRSY